MRKKWHQTSLKTYPANQLAASKHRLLTELLSLTVMWKNQTQSLIRGAAYLKMVSALKLLEWNVTILKWATNENQQTRILSKQFFTKLKKRVQLCEARVVFWRSSVPTQENRTPNNILLRQFIKIGRLEVRFYFFRIGTNKHSVLL